MRLKHITPLSKTQSAAPVVVCGPTTEKFALLVVWASAKIAAKTNKPLGALETRLQLGLKKSMMVGRS